MPFDELNEQLERAVLAAAKQAENAAKATVPGEDAMVWTDMTAKLAHALAAVRNAY